ncbi:nuclear pore complex protein Nup88-like [Ostrinia nubilalis]|uniref:nuclear pore complex protein Nup88-like n=1 Tax=Ostrinia nubilalis TaxID=29057 RepID=UPI0030825BED
MDSNRLYESKLADDETFKAFREGLAENPSGKLRNLIELKDDVVFFWSPVECCFLCLNLNQFDEFEVLDTPYQKLHLHSPPAFQVERIKGSNCGSRMCVWGSKGVTVMELPARWGRSGLFESGNYSILCKGLALQQPPFTVERIKGSNCGSRMCVWGSKGVTVMELPARWGRSGLFESGNYSILCK